MKLTEFEKNIIKAIRDIHIGGKIYITDKKYRLYIKKEQLIFDKGEEKILTSEEKKGYKKFL